MADAAPKPVYTTRAPSRRRARASPRTTYRRSPGAASRPVPRTAPKPAPRSGGLLRLARFIPFRGFVDLFFGGVSSNTERAIAAQQSGLDYLTERAWSRLARGTERAVRVSRAAPRASQTSVPGRDAAGVANPLVRPAALPAPQLAPVSIEAALRAVSPELRPEIFGSGETAPTPAPPPKPSAPAPAPLLEVPLLPQFFSNFGARPSPLLTPAQAPEVRSSPLSNPFVLAEPVPEPQTQRCRCRRRKAGKPGKGFFVINSRGTERRRYWS